MVEWSMTACIASIDDEDDVDTLGLADAEEGAGDYLVLSRMRYPEEQDIAHGGDRHYLEISGAVHGAYGVVTRAALTANALSLELREDELFGEIDRVRVVLDLDPGARAGFLGAVRAMLEADGVPVDGV